MTCTWAVNIAFKNWYPSLTSYSQKKLCSKLLSVQRVTFTWATEKRNLYSKVVCRYTRLHSVQPLFSHPELEFYILKRQWSIWSLSFASIEQAFFGVCYQSRVPQLCHTRHCFWDTSASHTCKSLLVVSPGLQRRRADRLNLLGRLALCTHHKAEGSGCNRPIPVRV